MNFGIAQNIRSKVQACTPALLDETLDSPRVASICAEIEDALEAYRRGELSRDEYDTMKGELKKQLPIFTFHATFKNGRRKNDEAIPSGLSIYDLDHIANPRARWDEIAPRATELGIVLAHISPSLEGLRLVFIVPTGMTLAEAQAWMARQLGDECYDACVKDYARCSFAVPRGYVLFMSEKLRGKSEELMPAGDANGYSLHDGVILSETKDLAQGLCQGTLRDSSHSLGMTDTNGLSYDTKGAEQYPTDFDGIEYNEIVSVLEEQMGGKPEHGSRNNFIFSMACHLRYVTNDDPEWIASILPTYGEGREKWMATIRSACNRNQTKAMPRIMRRTLAICKERLEDKSEIINHKS